MSHNLHKTWTDEKGTTLESSHPTPAPPSPSDGDVPSKMASHQASHGGGGQQQQQQAMDATRSYVTARTYDTEGKSVGGSIAPPPGAMAQPQPASLPAFFKVCACVECYLPSREALGYDYTYDDVSGKKPPQSYPRIRERGEFYIDSFNGEPWSCSFGTAEKVSNECKEGMRRDGIGWPATPLVWMCFVPVCVLRASRCSA